MKYLILFLLAVAPQDPDRALTGIEKTDHFTIRYRPGTRAAAAVDRIAVMAEREFAAITRALEVKPEGGLELHLYDDLAELVAVTRTRGNAGFSSGNASHLPFDNDQTRFHEMVHLIAVRIPKSGEEPRNLFFAEGLANALLEFVHGVHVHAVAAFEMKRLALPPLGDMTGAADFYAWMAKRPDLNAYDVAGSWFRHLLDAHGVEKVKQYYTGTPAKAAFGAAEAELEAAWHKRLAAFKLRPEVEVLLRRKRGEDARFASLELDPDKRLPKEILGKPGDWKPLNGEPGPGWKRVEGALEGVSETPGWNLLALGDAALWRDAIVRAKILPGPGCIGVQLQLGPDCQAMLTVAGTFVWKGGVVAVERGETITGRHSLDLVLERRGKEVTIWLDGFKIVSGVASDEAAKAGIGVAGGTARFENVRVRELK